MKNKSVQSVIKHPKKLFLISFLCAVYYFSLPKDLFNAPTATVLESNDNTLIGATIASDWQCRFPKVDSVPYKFKTCILHFEDAHFYKHLVFNPISMAKAVKANFSAGKTVRGGSTITQQVIRLARKNKNRSYLEKGIELVWATRLELRHSKKEMLKLYVSNAPFGVM